MKRGTRASLITKQRKRVEVEIDGETFTLQRISGLERDQFLAKIRGADEPTGEAQLVARCLIDDESGARMFADDEIDQLNAGICAMDLSQLSKAALQLNGFDKQVAEHIAKNSESAPSAASTSA